jgi:uncharacterized OsmC-like protein
VTHHLSLDIIKVQTPKEFGGIGQTYTSTDLLASALTTCMASSIALLMERNGIDLSKVQFNVDKQLSINPKALQSITINININDEIDSILAKKIKTCIQQCLIYKLLCQQLEIQIKIKHSSIKL